MERAAAGDARAIEGFAEVGSLPGHRDLELHAALTPDCVVLGGGVSAAGPLLLEPIRAEVTGAGCG